MIASIVSQNRHHLCKSNVVFSHLLLHFSTVIDPTVSEMLMRKHNFSPEAASLAASVLRNPHKIDSVISFLKQNGFSKTQLDKMVQCWPQFLSADLENTIKPKIKIFQDLGFSAKDTIFIISNDARIFRQSLTNRIVPCLSTLKNLLGSNIEVAKLLKSCGWFLETNLDNNLVQNIELLKNYGIPTENITRALPYFVMLLLRKPKIVKKIVEKVEEMGIKRSSRMFIHAVRVFGSMSDKTWENKVRAFRELGFSEEDITATFRNMPLVFAVSEQKMKEVKEILLATGKYKMSCIVKYPLSLMFSVEKRYKPRIQVLEVLESKSVIERWPCLSVLCTLSENEFDKRFVGPYLDHVGDVYVAKSVIGRKREVERVEPE